MALKIKEFTLVNDCFQSKHNAAIGLYRQTLFKLLGAQYTNMGGKGRFAVYAKADKRISEKKSVPSGLVRPYTLPDKEGKEKYYVTKNRKGTFLKSISKADIAKFMLDAAKDDQWDGSPAVHLGGA